MSDTEAMEESASLAAETSVAPVAFRLPSWSTYLRTSEIAIN